MSQSVNLFFFLILAILISQQIGSYTLFSFFIIFNMTLNLANCKMSKTFTGLWSSIPQILAALKWFILYRKRNKSLLCSWNLSYLKNLWKYHQGLWSRPSYSIPILPHSHPYLNYCTENLLDKSPVKSKTFPDMSDCPRHFAICVIWLHADDSTVSCILNRADR